MGSVNPVERVQFIAGGYCLSRCLHAIANLGVADALGETARSAADLAARVGADTDALERVMRLLAAHGVFESDGVNFRHSAASRLLQASHPHSMRAFVQMFGLPVFWDSFAAIEHTVQTGRPATPTVVAGGFWDYLTQQPAAGHVFHAAMRDKANGAIAGVMEAYDFSAFRTIADIGGGHGQLIRAIVTAVPETIGVLFDLPHVVEAVTDIACERLILQAGDFFSDALPACNCYLLMEVIHDWGDDESVAILTAVARASQPGAKVLVIESIVPDQPGPDWSKLLDVLMLTLLGGRQRTQQEYAALFSAAGLRFEREIDAGTGFSILEATRT